MTKNIYEILGFKKPKDYLYEPRIVEEAKQIFNQLPLRRIGLKPLLIEQTVFEETFAISTAEDSELSQKMAKTIEVSPEQTARLIKYKENKNLTAIQKYDQLEFENIRAAVNQVSSFSFKDLNLELIKNLHHDLTIGLDEYVKIKGISAYHPGTFRHSDEVKVGKLKAYTPPKFQKIPELLQLLFEHFARRRKINLYDILEFHVLFYAIHPFQNGNKRVARILESMLIHHYGYSAERTISLSAHYFQEKSGFHFFLMESLLQKDPTFFINYAIRGYFSAGHKILVFTQNLYLKDFEENFLRYLDQDVKLLHHDNYETAMKVIVDLKGAFSYSDFIKTMKKRKISVGTSQNIIKTLAEKNILKKQQDHYYFGKALELEKLVNKLYMFFLQYNIDPREGWTNL